MGLMYVPGREVLFLKVRIEFGYGYRGWGGG